MRLQELDILDQAGHVSACVSNTDTAHNQHHLDELLIDVRKRQVRECYIASIGVGVSDELGAAGADHVAVSDERSFGLEPQIYQQMRVYLPCRTQLTLPVVPEVYMILCSESGVGGIKSARFCDPIASTVGEISNASNHRSTNSLPSARSSTVMPFVAPHAFKACDLGSPPTCFPPNLVSIVSQLSTDTMSFNSGHLSASLIRSGMCDGAEKTTCGEGRDSANCEKRILRPGSTLTSA